MFQETPVSIWFDLALFVVWCVCVAASVVSVFILSSVLMGFAVLIGGAVALILLRMLIKRVLLILA